MYNMILCLAVLLYIIPDSYSITWKSIWEAKGLESSATPLHALAGYDALSQQQWNMLVEKTSSHLLLAKANRLFEFGVGSSAYTTQLKKLYPHLNIAGVDYSETLVRQAVLRDPKTHVFIGDITNTSFVPSASYDRVISFSVFEYLPSESHARQALHEMGRILGPTGIIMVGDVRHPEQHHVVHEKREEARKKQKRHASETPPHLHIHPNFFKLYGEQNNLSTKIISGKELGIEFYYNAGYSYCVYFSR